MDIRKFDIFRWGHYLKNFKFYVLNVPPIFWKRGDIIQGRTLYKGGHYLRKYGISKKVEILTFRRAIVWQRETRWSRLWITWEKKVINFCLWSSANQNHIFPSIRCRHYKVRNVLTNFLNVRKKNSNSNSVCGPLRIKTIITIRIRVSRSILFLNRRCFLTYGSANTGFANVHEICGPFWLPFFDELFFECEKK